MAGRFFFRNVFVVLAVAVLVSGLARQQQQQQQQEVPRDAPAVDCNNNTLPIYSPARPPAVPLAVRSPYLSAWSKTASGGTLNCGNPIFWKGPPIGWEGIVAVDGIPYEYLGSGLQWPSTPARLQPAIPKTVSYDSQYSNFTFLAGPVTIEASFFSPVTPKDLCRSSIPLSYLTVSAKSNDYEEHNVKFYSDINGAWMTPVSTVNLVWDMKSNGQDYVLEPTKRAATNRATGSGNGISTWIYSLETPYLFGEDDDFPQWGNMTYSSSPDGFQTFSFESGFAPEVRARFVDQHELSNTVDRNYRGWGVQEPVFAFAHDAGNVTSAQVRYTVGSVQTPVVRYLNVAGSSAVAPWWEKCYGDLYSVIDFHWNDFDAVSQLGATFEAQLRADVSAYYKDSENSTSQALTGGNITRPRSEDHSNTSGQHAHSVDRYGNKYMFDPGNAHGYQAMNKSTGIPVPEIDETEAYYSILALSARQVMGAYVYAIPSSGTASCDGGLGFSDGAFPLMFQKEISSDGNINTVDVLFPATPFFLWANPEMLKYTLEPMYQNTESGYYPNGYSMHDLGTNYPNATGHLDGADEYMPVEESGDMILMSYAYYKFSGNTAWLRSHYATLKQWAEFLTGSSLVPANQLSTDDFAGKLVNQTNLAIKGIIALQAMGAIGQAAGEPADAASFSATSAAYYQQWEGLAIDAGEGHALLSYQWRSSWGLLYNTYMDVLLGLGAVRPELHGMQCAWYAGRGRAYGVPLDSRATYTKSDWEMWAAATCGPATRGLLVGALARWIGATATDLPLADLYDTAGAGGYPPGLEFKARPVVGGHFSLLALYRAVLLDGRGGGGLDGTVYGPQPWPTAS